MTISIRTRRDVVVVDPDRFLAAARQALRDRNSGLTEADAAEAAWRAALAAEVNRQLDLAAGKPADDLSRHESLRAAVAWSYELLDSVEQAVFRRLSLLPDGAADITAAALSHGLGLDGAALWAVLTSLTAKSMLTTEAATRPRFGMPAAMCEYGRELLDASGERAAVTELLLAWLDQQAADPLDESRRPA